MVATAAKRESKLQPYCEQLMELRQQGVSFRALTAALKEHGVSVSPGTIESFLSTRMRRQASENVGHHREVSAEPTRTAALEKIRKVGRGIAQKEAEPKFTYTQGPLIFEDEKEG